ncbi:GNAT family N-acetyltransferase [Rhizomonospora bruguierae]|uniref:GNAT family N-acetyltransferase n=1 Tax=Rhizomonospora bruguierae TaxID=1581705 RepID=UPI001BCA9922|nr:GNAT family N-acetyltransferase [Micromonospora sp. NBRC 107566]
MTNIVAIAAAATYPLRSSVLGWAEPRSRLDDDDAAHLAIIEDGAVVAVVSHVSWPYPPETGTPARYFWAMAVDPARQRRGYGRRLLAAVAECARLAGERLMWADARQSAVDFYVACGARSDERPYIDDVTGLLDHRVVFVIDDHPAPT